ncbi:ThiF family adenylyltransferase [Fictibacillus sp. KIGAM418]|uniref:ThiF family adenylyltransferase n=1 Tax=Fictibacillus marinisediminis TaxID=2878389 RepID=A0A9X1XH32_9BACL|nr:ThiF family adenylyltransferase [Fictibacillus marinisediminis]MCK6259583.1 ThiF family adenylyltransferase [Fictibacillus marinisediminis]
MLPCFKRTLLPIVQKLGTIEIRNNGTFTELEDDNGELFRFLKLLDGKNTLNDLSIQMNLSIVDIQSVIHSLDELGFLEDAEVPSTYSPTELERYRSNLNYFSGFSSITKDKYSYQDKLKNSKIVILGLGGGCLIGAYLAGLGIGEIIGVDFDVVERSNLNRQFLYNEKDVGRLKSEVAEEKIKAINPEIKVKMLNKYIDSYESLLEILSGATAVISMLDQPSIISTRWVNAACVVLGIPYYSGGINHNTIKVERYIPENNEPCYDCKLINSLNDSTDMIARIKTTYGSVLSGVNTGFASNLSLLVSFIINDVTNLITNLHPMMKPVLTIDLKTMEVSQMALDFTQNNDCPTCNSEGFKNLSSLDDLISISFRKEGSLL